MKKVKFFAMALASLVIAFPSFSESITLNWGNGETLTIDTSDSSGANVVGNVPLDIIKIAAEHLGEIQTALANARVSSSDAKNALNQATTAYKDYVNNSGISTLNPYTTTVNGLNDFSDIMLDVVPNTQIQQNVWANAWIGHILPKPNLGFGINAGVSKLDLKPLITVADALGMKDGSSIPETLAMPTITADVRVGGFILPFDVGFTAMSIDANTIKPIGKKLDPAYFDFFMLGGDVRYAILKGGLLRPKLSVGLGGYYTKGNFGVEQDGSRAQLDFDTTSIVLSTQASIKLLCLVPFVGARVMMSKSNVDWKVHANWASILNTNNSNIEKALSYGFLPSDFSDGVSSKFTNHVRPVLYGGFAIDMMVVDLTFSASYDVVSKIPSGAVSLRLALN